MGINNTLAFAKVSPYDFTLSAWFGEEMLDLIDGDSPGYKYPITSTNPLLLVFYLEREALSGVVLGDSSRALT